MQYLVINAEKYPPLNGESWWIVHPNRKGCEFRAPIDAVTICMESLDDYFQKNEMARIHSVDNTKGRISVKCSSGIVDMPFYFFGRYFDAEVFVVGSATPEELEKAIPFDYKATIPVKFADSRVSK